MFGNWGQADGYDSVKRGGTGLGLSIVREIVVRLGGSVDFESVEGAGSIFHIDLPAAEPPGVVPTPSEVEAPLPSDPTLPVVLHVDDDPDMLAVVARAFARKGAPHPPPSVAAARPPPPRTPH